MKRGRGVSNAARTLSTATAQGIITDEQKLWLRSVLAEGDPAVEEALDQASLGNSQPLKDLVLTGNLALRARLHTLSKDNEFQRLSYSRSQDDGSNLLDLDMLTEDLRFSSLGNTIDNPEKILDDEKEESGTDENGFDLEALLDEVTGMMTATTSTEMMNAKTSNPNSIDENSQVQQLPPDLELDFTFGDQESENGDHCGSMISSSSDGGGGHRGNLSVRGSLMLAQMRARESSSMQSNIHGGSLSGLDGERLSGLDDAGTHINSNRLGEMNDGINLSIIDDYFVDENTTTSRVDFDSIDRSMLAVLAQDDTFSPQQTKFKGSNKYNNISKNQVWSVEEPPPPPTAPHPSHYQQQQQAGFQQPFYSPFMFGSCGGIGQSNNPQSSNRNNNGTWNGPSSHTGASSPMMVPPYGSPPAHMMPGVGGGWQQQQQQPASWTAGMDPLQVLQMQHRAQVMQRNGMMPGPVDHHFNPDAALSSSSHSSNGSNKRGRGQRMSELCNRFDMIQNRLNLTSQQRELVFLILNRDDKFLTKQFDTAIGDAEKGRPEQLIGLINKAESMSSNLKEVGSLSTSNHSTTSNNSYKNAATPSSPASASSRSASSSSSSSSSSVVPLSPEEEESFQFQSILASAQAACASLDLELLKEHESILKQSVLKCKTSAVALRDAKQFDGALKVMKELKQAQAILDKCQAQIVKAQKVTEEGKSVGVL